MSVASGPWLRWALPAALAVVLALSAYSWWVQPENTRVCFVALPTGAQASIVLADQSPQQRAPEDRPCSAWRLQLRIDSAVKPPGPEWMMFEGAKPGEGYELHWLPGRLGLQVFRAGDAVLLGSATLERFPVEVVFARRGYRLTVEVDGRQVLACLDPLPTPPPVSWGFHTAGPLGDTSISLHDDRRLLGAAESAALRSEPRALAALLADTGRADHALLRVRYALGAFDPGRNPGGMERALEDANAAVRALGALHPDRARLQTWLAWGEVLLELARQDGDAVDLTNAALEQLMVLTQQDPVGESAGLLLHLLDRLAQRACARPVFRTAPEEVLRARAAWLGLLGSAADAARAVLPPGSGSDWGLELDLLVHATACLRGRSPEATPADRPEWLVSRWRALAGINPDVKSFTSAIPANPDDRNPIRPALERVLQSAELEPVAAVVMRARILDELERPVPAAASAEVQADIHRATEQALQGARDAVPPREALLAQALLALRGFGDANAALQALDPDPKHTDANADGLPLARRDPLAYALYRLIQHRLGDSRGSGKGLLDSAPTVTLPDTLSRYDRLLSGRPDATQEVFLTDPALLPAAQALAAALAMQEVVDVDAKPAWKLIDALPCYTLPLGLLAPRTGPAGGAGKGQMVP